MNKSELFKSREQRILTAALSTARSKGALDFRMADVARVAECSVGTLYGHFLSKEDMMAALVQVALQRRQIWFKQVQEMPLSPLEQFVVLLLSERTRLVQDEVLAQLEMLVSYSELWRRAADQRQIALRQSVNELGDALKQVLASANSALDEAQLELLAERGRALMVGIQLQSSRQTLAPAKVLGDDLVMMEALVAMLTAAGLPKPDAGWQQRCVEALAHSDLQLASPLLSEDAA
ncbi:TetR/AcrR family transcriptional regulator [Ferrimonas marina]|uniref:Transcriptional regulator, TetR family n=1 Tax=Ferrimonas marina TaxID=299255 RepID=A0A1M5ZB72_9GAMM|nr:TetR/AcrR family transcriptional regulator [Ferrimonas marina]SHI21432.1 transcriptional regulator, TetR family [Ferrimonas marina]